MRSSYFLGTAKYQNIKTEKELKYLALFLGYNIYYHLLQPLKEKMPEWNIVCTGTELMNRIKENGNLDFSLGYVSAYERNHSYAALYLHNALVMLANSYAISERIYNEHEYANMIECRWGKIISNVYLNTQTFIAYTRRSLDGDINSAFDRLLSDFFMPCEDYNEPSSWIDHGYAIHGSRTGLNLLIMYNEMVKIQVTDYKTHPEGIDINLPVFYMTKENTRAIEYHKFHIPQDFIKLINTGEMMSYGMYLGMITSMSDIAKSVLKEKYSYIPY